MQWTHHYDRVARRAIVLARLLVAANMLSAVYFALRRKWELALCNGLWICNLVFQERAIAREQRLRDEVRLLTAAMEEK